MRIFLSTSSFNPEAGGPARSVPQLAKALTKLNVEVALWAPDGSAISSPLLQDVSGLWRFGGTAEDAWNGFGEVDVLHDNGVWSRHHWGLSRLAISQSVPLIISSRGMLEPWALNHKAIRKWLAWRIYQRNILKKARVLHATADSEAAQLRHLGLHGEVFVIPNGVELPDWSQVKDKRNEVKVIKSCLFMSRLHPKKGLPLLLEAWSKLHPEGWRLDIVGPDEGRHRLELEELIDKLDIGKNIRFLGALEGEEKHQVLAQADIFVLPTHSENFGIVVAEAMAYGCPVIATHGAPWAVLERENCGWWVPVSTDAITNALREATELSVEERNMMGDRGRDVVERDFLWSNIALKFVELYGSAIK